MSLPVSCCICASILSVDSELYDSSTEKPIHQHTFPCCGRVVCTNCITSNARFATYCPFCQTARLPRLDEQPEQPPPYSPPSPKPDPAPSRTPPPAPYPRHATLAHPPDSDPPPAYAPITPPSEHNYSTPSSPRQLPRDVVHYLNGEDSLQSLSLAYSTPVYALRSHNQIHADHLLSARRKVHIPAAYYQGPSLSPKPLISEEEQERRLKIRKLMVKCKVSDYKIATLYLEEAGWDLEAAIDKWKGDEKWELENPLASGSSRRGQGNRGSAFRENIDKERVARLLS